MGIISSLLKNVGVGISGKRTWTPTEVRDLIATGGFAEASRAAAALSIDTPQREVVAICLHGEISFRLHHDAEAEEHFRKALTLSPGCAEAHYGLSLVMLAGGQHEMALRHAQFAANVGTEARFSAQLGHCHLEMRNFVQAENALKRATRLDALDKSSWNNLGIARRARSNLHGARKAFERALSIDPAFDQARVNASLLDDEFKTFRVKQETQAVMPAADHVSENPILEKVNDLENAGEIDAAIEACEQLELAHPEESAIAIKLYRLWCSQGDTRMGLDALEAFRSRYPDDTDVMAELGIALVREGEFKAAKPLVNDALERRPQDVPLLLAMADIRGEQGRHADAGELIERAYEIDQGLNIRGKLATNLVVRCRYEDALEMIDSMLADEPGVAEDVVGAKVYALTHLGRFDEAEPLLDKTIQKNPTEPNRRFPRASINLLNERFAEGWDDYAFRNLSCTKHLRMMPFPQWKGESLEGKTLLVIAEQGLGDQVMFASCLPDLVPLNPGRTIVEVIDRVAPTIARSFPMCEVVATKQDNEFEWVPALGHVDYFVPMGDLPQRFRRQRSDFPNHGGYLHADPLRVAHWRDALATTGSRPKIGLSWRGGTEVTRRGVRTMDVTMLNKLTSGIDADWVCLQYGDVKEDLARAEASGLSMRFWPNSIKDLDEFAALISALDLVITVCNTTVHYAGGVGTPVWVMAPKVPEWRYGLYSTVLPWYPSSRIYRQQEHGEWLPLLQQVFDDLYRRFPPTEAAHPSISLGD